LCVCDFIKIYIFNFIDNRAERGNFMKIKEKTNRIIANHVFVAD